MKQVIQKVVLGAAIINDGRVLILQRSPDETTYPGLWELPSGKREPLEKSVQTLKREVFEETGLKIRPIIPVSVFDYQIEKPDLLRDSTQIDFLATSKKGTEIKLSSEHKQYAWIKVKDLNRYRMSNSIKKVIKTAFKIYGTKH